MRATRTSSEAPWLINRERLVQALQGACFGSSQNLPRLRAAIATFADESSRLGMDRDWIRRAVDSAVDSALTPPLKELRRRAFFLTVGALTDEACEALGSRSVPLAAGAKLTAQNTTFGDGTPGAGSAWSGGAR
jgi:hypothetical protein